MTHHVDTSTPPDTPQPIGPYSHIAKVGPFITIGGTAGIDPATGQLAGSDTGRVKQALHYPYMPETYIVLTGY